MQWRVYYLYSEKIKKYYIGKTNGLSRRLREHNLGQEIYTKRGIPWKLVGYINCESNTEAVQIEDKLKKSKNKKYTKWYIKSNGVIMDR